MKIVYVVLGMMLCSFVGCGLSAQANGGVGAGFEGSLGVNQIRVVSEGSIPDKKKVSPKTLEQEPIQISQPEKTVEKKPRKQPSKEEFAKIVANNKLYMNLEKALLAMDFQGFVKALQEANKELGAWFGQGKFKKLAQQKIHDIAIRDFLIENQYDKYVAYMETAKKTKIRKEEQFAKQRAKEVLRQKLMSILEQQDYEGFVELRHASQASQK